MTGVNETAEKTTNWLLAEENAKLALVWYTEKRARQEATDHRAILNKDKLKRDRFKPPVY